MKHLIIIMLFVITLAITGNAQETVTPTAQIATSKVTAEIIAASSTKVVKGAPFSAEGISESVQVLPDGNRIARSATTKMYRDGEGRFRREGTGSGSGAAASAYGSIVGAYGFQEMISIFDPVESVRYVLTPSTKTASRFDAQNKPTEPAVIVSGYLAVAKAQTELKAVEKATAQSAQSSGNVIVTGKAVSASTFNAGKSEPLGTKSFEGVEAEGTRTVTTIAAGAIGNEKPIEIVYERWFSKELDLIVYSRHYDPRFGEQTYRLININRSEPDRSLFTVPSNYTVVSESKLNVIKQFIPKEPER